MFEAQDNTPDDIHQARLRRNIAAVDRLAANGTSWSVWLHKTVSLWDKVYDPTPPELGKGLSDLKDMTVDLNCAERTALVNTDNTADTFSFAQLKYRVMDRMSEVSTITANMLRDKE
jgi:hypothetical protein